MHLQYFAGPQPKGHIWTYDAYSDHVRPAVPEQTAVQGHFYSVPKADGTMDIRIEEFLSEVEDKAAPVYRALLQKQVPGAVQNRADFATFLALMYFRTPAIRRLKAEFESQTHQIRAFNAASNDDKFAVLVDFIEKNKGSSLAEDDKKDLRQGLVDPSAYVVQFPAEETLSVLRGADELAPILFDMNWCVVRPCHSFFITSDQPLVRLIDPSTRDPTCGDQGFLNKSAVVIFPLSPQLLLRLSWAEVPTLLVIERDHVQQINRCFAAHADRYLYAHIEDRRLQRLAAEFRNVRTKVVVTTRPLSQPRGFAETEVVRVRTY